MPRGRAKFSTMDLDLGCDAKDVTLVNPNIPDETPIVGTKEPSNIGMVFKELDDELVIKELSDDIELKKPTFQQAQRVMDTFAKLPSHAGKILEKIKKVPKDTLSMPQSLKSEFQGALNKDASRFGRYRKAANKVMDRAVGIKELEEEIVVKGVWQDTKDTFRKHPVATTLGGAALVGAGVGTARILARRGGVQSSSKFLNKVRGHEKNVKELENKISEHKKAGEHVRSGINDVEKKVNDLDKHMKNTKRGLKSTKGTKKLLEDPNHVWVFGYKDDMVVKKITGRQVFNKAVDIADRAAPGALTFGTLGYLGLRQTKDKDVRIRIGQDRSQESQHEPSNGGRMRKLGRRIKEKLTPPPINVKVEKVEKGIFQQVVAGAKQIGRDFSPMNRATAQFAKQHKATAGTLAAAKVITWIPALTAAANAAGIPIPMVTMSLRKKIVKKD